MGCWILTRDPVVHRLANDFCSFRHWEKKGCEDTGWGGYRVGQGG